MNPHSTLFAKDCRRMFQLAGILQDYDPLLALLESRDFLFIDTTTTFHLLSPQDYSNLHSFFIASEVLEIKTLLYLLASPSLKKTYAPFSRLFITNEDTEFMYVATYPIFPSPRAVKTKGKYWGFYFTTSLELLN
jgi:hypothetical protein